jgi:2-polyprenyl-3-methyl-5-hydroxy-6-metoxy-1,4-benzoquinol methylase
LVAGGTSALWEFAFLEVWCLKTSNEDRIFNLCLKIFTMIDLFLHACGTDFMSKQTFLDIQAKARYLRRILYHRWHGQARVCPYCGPSGSVKLVRRKKMIVEILQCQNCHLLFRWPADTASEHDSYYQEDFAKDAPQVILPGDTELNALKEKNFSGSPLDINTKIRVLQALRPGSRVLDFGCSWGYGTYQFRRQNFDAIGFEVSKPRAEFGRQKLDLNIMDSFDDLAELPDGSFDIVFSNHVVEHLPNIGSTFALLTRLLNRDGFVFHVLPNFMGKLGRSGHWIEWIGEDHPVAPAMPFFEYAIPRAGLTKPTFGSDPFDERMAKELAAGPIEHLSTEGIELLVYARKLTAS